MPSDGGPAFLFVRINVSLEKEPGHFSGVGFLVPILARVPRI